MAMLISSEPLVFGFQDLEGMDLSAFGEGVKIRFRFRNDSFAQAFVRHHSGHIQQYFVKKEGNRLIPIYPQAVNIHAQTVAVRHQEIARPEPRKITHP